MAEPSTRDILDLAARHVEARDNVPPRVAKATVHHMPWRDLLAIVEAHTVSYLRERTPAA